ncbi:MAG: hypothetical protein H6608_05870 [Flavobacteriales bacterium]|nr:hypothetical protein [Flavobacteriales bacterium]
MKTLIQNPKRAALILTGLIIVLMAGLTGYYKMNASKLSGALDGEKLKTEKLLSEKLQLEKEIDGLNADLSKIQGEKKNLDAQLTLEKEKSAKPKIVYTSGASVKNLKKEIESLKALKNNLTKQLEDANARIAAMENSKTDMENQIASLTAQNKKMKEDLALMQSTNADQFQMAAYKGKHEKQTLKAKRTNKLSTRFTVPSYVAGNVGFKVVMPDGKVVDKTAKGMSIMIINDVEEQYANVNSEMARETLKEIELTYAPDQKLKSGTYKVELYNGGNYITSCVISLK